ncbi:Capsule polysaccharide biosynthesis protein [Thiorhodococcus drewsii AZ1]|uniref:Capsule polysaccharide biosynthesis protein n=1 Tax=Thiorhodococcus drewsii AZ1 TaxID=765913 RepID=G2E5W2_9GAMM|nr:capsular polysaccharide biosynthesis protein [Thiorhodococcus drewsii]EGV28525.1 Capsule polysaccharide biosynthesis protein [Thiorhodococcus drewsii AZ1]
MIGILSRGIQRIPALETFLGEPITSLNPLRAHPDLTAIAGWGLKSTSRRARNYAHRHGLPYIALEDGFLRSVGLGNQDPPLSLIVDDLGIYYDATQPSRLESLIPQALSDTELARARSLRSAWCNARVSKYNHLPEECLPLPCPAVLVADQTFGDPAIQLGLAEPASFQRMLVAALDENPGATILVKIHPDVYAGRKRGHFDPQALSKIDRVHLLTRDIHPVSVLEQVETVYTVTSQLGFEALIWGRQVRTFGMPFYAGWGLTQDEQPAPERRSVITLEQLIHAALIACPRYLDPETNQRCEVERVLDWMGLQRQLRERFAEPIQAIDFSPWKRPLVKRFLQGSELGFGRQIDQALPGETLAVWGLRSSPAGQKTLRLEDGFLRSVGLGADLVQPLSWVVDSRGLYYDASRPSDLEVILQNRDFDPALLSRARKLREKIVESGLTKYNVGTSDWQPPSGAKRIILVAGQVETDASLRLATPGIRRNMDLLRRVRHENPDAYVIYKPHPDVLAGLRAGGENERLSHDWCDDLVTQASMATLLNQVNEVHVLTSLAGFEALLRDKRVVCHGQPFYSGWGLTLDREPLARRTRVLNIDMLVAGTLLLYPTYVSRITNRYTTPERALDELLMWKEQSACQGELTRWRRILRPILGWIAEARSQTNRA